MSSQPVEHLHPVLDFAHRLVSRLESLADAPLMSMRPEDKRAALVTLAQGRAQLDALALRLLADEALPAIHRDRRRTGILWGLAFAGGSEPGHLTEVTEPCSAAAWSHGLIKE